jgi:hypothetical protein
MGRSLIWPWGVRPCGCHVPSYTGRLAVHFKLGVLVSQSAAESCRDACDERANE